MHVSKDALFTVEDNKFWELNTTYGVASFACRPEKENRSAA
jgi:hypothetical protein